MFVLFVRHLGTPSKLTKSKNKDDINIVNLICNLNKFSFNIPYFILLSFYLYFRAPILNIYYILNCQ